MTKSGRLPPAKTGYKTLPGYTPLPEIVGGVDPIKLPDFMTDIIKDMLPGGVINNIYVSSGLGNPLLTSRLSPGGDQIAREVALDMSRGVEIDERPPVEGDFGMIPGELISPIKAVYHYRLGQLAQANILGALNFALTIGMILRDRREASMSSGYLAPSIPGEPEVHPFLPREYPPEQILMSPVSTQATREPLLGYYQEVIDAVTVKDGSGKLTVPDLSGADLMTKWKPLSRNALDYAGGIDIARIGIRYKAIGRTRWGRLEIEIPDALRMDNMNGLTDLERRRIFYSVIFMAITVASSREETGIGDSFSRVTKHYFDPAPNIHFVGDGQRDEYTATKLVNDYAGTRGPISAEKLRSLRADMADINSAMAERDLSTEGIAGPANGHAEIATKYPEVDQAIAPVADKKGVGRLPVISGADLPSGWRPFSRVTLEYFRGVGLPKVTHFDSQKRVITLRIPRKLQIRHMDDVPAEERGRLIFAAIIMSIIVYRSHNPEDTKIRIDPDSFTFAKVVFDNDIIPRTPETLWDILQYYWHGRSSSTLPREKALKALKVDMRHLNAALSKDADLDQITFE